MERYIIDDVKYILENEFLGIALEANANSEND